MFAGCYPLIIPSDQAELSDQSGAFHTSHPEGGKFFFALQGIIQILQKACTRDGTRDYFDELTIFVTCNDDCQDG
jgi:hypothetical protein